MVVGWASLGSAFGPADSTVHSSCHRATVLPPLRPCFFRRAQYDADQLPEAKRTLTKALHLAPTDHNLRFNVAVTMQVGVLVMACLCVAVCCLGFGHGDIVQCAKLHYDL